MEARSLRPAARRWIISSWADQLSILATPLLAIPAVLSLNSGFGVSPGTISLIVTSFFALGHHLPGMIRAYGDRELFQRFRWRFILAPPLLFLAYVPLQQSHPDFIRMVVVFWATWHGLMQLYGFVRIYDAKVGSTSAVTAWWDWLICFCGFTTAQMFCGPRVASVLGHWYALGGPLIPPFVILACKWIFLAIAIVVLIGFFVNYVVQHYYGVKPNPIKLLLLVSGIGTWWFAVVYVQNVILGVALFDICHDVQYLAIVWLYNCGRVKVNPQSGRFMSYLFRRGMVLLYLGLIAAYGAIGLIPSFVEDGRLSTFLTGFLGTSTLLHYYYDGFIWKVREKSTQAGLGLATGIFRDQGSRVSVDAGMHLLKWSPLILMTGTLLASDMVEAPITPIRKKELDQQYVQSLTGKTILPGDKDEISWLYSQFEQAQATAASVPEDADSQLRAAILLANFGRNDEAVDVIEKLLSHHPEFSSAYMTLGEINLYRGLLDKASACFQSAYANAATDLERSVALLKQGEVHLNQQQIEPAKKKFEEAMKYNPKLKASVDSYR